MEFRFNTKIKPSSLDELFTFLGGNQLWIPQDSYKDYDRWLDKTRKEISIGKRDVVVCRANRRIVGTVIHRLEPENNTTVGIRLIRVERSQAGQHIAAFMLRQAERQAANYHQCVRALVDTKVDNLPVRHFLEYMGYRPLVQTDLYKLGDKPDILYEKDLTSLRK